MSAEVSAELLLGREVRDSNGEALGRITDICAGDDDGELVVRYYRVSPARGRYHLSLRSILPAVLRMLRLPLRRPSYSIAWNEMDLSDPTRPRARLARSALAAQP
jgi:hypothetical protein